MENNTIQCIIVLYIERNVIEWNHHGAYPAAGSASHAWRLGGTRRRQLHVQTGARRRACRETSWGKCRPCRTPIRRGAGKRSGAPTGRPWPRRFAARARARSTERRRPRTSGQCPCRRRRRGSTFDETRHGYSQKEIFFIEHTCFLMVWCLGKDEIGLAPHEIHDLIKYLTLLLTRFVTKVVFSLTRRVCYHSNV